MKRQPIFTLLTVVLTLLQTPSTQTGSQGQALSKLLIAAVKAKDLPEVKQLLADGANPNAREVLISVPNLRENDPGGKQYLGESVLNMAASDGELEMVRLLLDKGANVNGRGLANWTPLIGASSRGSVAIAKLLLDYGAKVDLRNEYGDTALVFAANNGNDKVAELLLSKGAKVHGVSGSSPLYHAAYNGQKSTVKLLLKWGADPNYTRLAWHSPIDGAVAQSHSDIVSILRKAGGKPRPAAALAKERKWLDDGLENGRRALRKEAALNSAKQQLTDTDVQVLNLFLEHLAQQRDVFIVREGRRLIAINSKTISRGFLGFDDQINESLSVSQALEIDLAMRSELHDRNPAATILKPFISGTKLIKLFTDSEIQDRFNIYGIEKEKARGWVQIALPGYSKLRDKAVVRFEVGPSAHGAWGTCLLVRNENTWRVKWLETRYGF